MGKNFKTVAEQFFSHSSQETEALPTNNANVPEGYKLNPMYVEVKSKRVQLILQPSLYAKAKSKAEEAGISFNEYVHRILLKAVNE